MSGGEQTMNKFPAISAIIMIIGVIGAIVINMHLYGVRSGEIYEDMNKDVVLEGGEEATVNVRMECWTNEDGEKKGLTYLPVLGIDKFWADIQWIRLLQDMGDTTVKLNPGDAASKDMAEYFAGQIDDITDLNPDFTLIYQVGAMHIANILPERSIGLLEKGHLFSTVPDWRRPYYCSIIVDRYIAKDVDDEEKKRALVERSKDYLEEAKEFSDRPFYIETAFLRKLIELRGVDQDDPLAVLKAKKEYYDEKIDELREQAGDVEGAEGDDEAMTPDAYIMGMDGEFDANLQKLREKLMEECQKLARDKWMQMKEAEEDVKEDYRGEHQEVTDIFLSLYPQGHYSPYSLSPFAAGDLFDRWTGDSLKEVPELLAAPFEEQEIEEGADWTYGYDKDHYEDTGAIVLIVGPYSTVTGAPTDEWR